MNLDFSLSLSVYKIAFQVKAESCIITLIDGWYISVSLHISNIFTSISPESRVPFILVPSILNSRIFL